MLCSKCGETMTGSSSTSKTGDKHFYYHCNYCTKERFPAKKKVNAELDALLELFKFKKNPSELYDIVLKKYLTDFGNTSKIEKQKAHKDFELAGNRFENLQVLFIDGKIESHEYSKLKAKFNSEMEIHKSVVSQYSDRSKDLTDINGYK